LTRSLPQTPIADPYTQLKTNIGSRKFLSAIRGPTFS
jgi:hypothetical protein